MENFCYNLIYTCIAHIFFIPNKSTHSLLHFWSTKNIFLNIMVIYYLTCWWKKFTIHWTQIDSQPNRKSASSIINYELLTSIFISCFIHLTISSLTNLAYYVENINTSFTPTRRSITVIVIFMKNSNRKKKRMK